MFSMCSILVSWYEENGVMACLLSKEKVLSVILKRIMVIGL